MVQVPTAAELKTRYPEFDGVGDGLVAAVITEASAMVDDSWVLEDQKPAIMVYAAHLLSVEGYPARAVNPGSFNPGTAGREIVARRVGDVSVQYAQSSSPGGSGLIASLGTTVYGRRFAQLLKLNAPAIGLV